MSGNHKYLLRIFCYFFLSLSAAVSCFAGVSRDIQDQYRQEYVNKAMFLKIPVYAAKQFIYISGQNIRFERGFGSPLYKLGDQLRILGIDFSGEEIKFKMGEIASSTTIELCYQFDQSLLEDFPNRDVFDRAIHATLTEGLKYQDLEDAKKKYIEEQFEISVREIAGSASVKRDSVLKNIAPLVPAYQEAQQEIDTLKNRVQNVSGQLSQAQSINRTLESESRTQQAEITRLKSANAVLQEKINDSTSQISRLGTELRDAKGTAQGYQRELASIQRSLNLKVNTGGDLSAQIAELGQAMRKLQKDNEAQLQQINSLQTDLDAQKKIHAQIIGDNEELKSSNKKMQSTISTLTSKEGSLQRKYLNLKNEKEKLDDFAQSLKLLHTRVVDEKVEDGIYSVKASVYLGNTLLGSLDWSVPNYLNYGQSKSAEAVFSAESIDTVRMTKEERHILRSLDENLKMRLELVSGSSGMTVTAEEKDPIHEIGERDRAAWQWSIFNQGTQDSRLVLNAYLINKNKNEIALLHQEHSVAASNAVRRLRSYLQPIPLIAGIVIGFLLFGIVGIFRRPKPPKHAPPKAPEGSPEHSSFVQKKKL